MLEVEVLEDRSGGSAAPVLDPSGDGDDPERDRHQDVPLPPGRMPVAAEDDRDHRLGQQGEGRGDRERHRRGPSSVERDVAHRCECVERQPDGAQDVERAVVLLRRERAVERRQLGERVDRPAREQREDALLAEATAAA